MKVFDILKILYAVFFLWSVFKKFKFKKFLYKKLKPNIKIASNNFNFIETYVNLICDVLLIKSCLLKSKIIYELCIANKIECNLLIGVRIDNKKLNSHAWVEYKQNQINHENYKIIFSI